MSLIIHPSNHRLFPNLQGIWRSFNQYRMDSTKITAQPLSSTLVSGAYLFALAPSTQVQNALPIFSTLINYATAKVATIFKPMVYKFAGDILHRLGSYLMDSADPSTSSPGTLHVSTSGTDQTNGAVAIMPVMTLNSNMHLKDFVPASPQPTPVQSGLSTVYTQYSFAGSSIISQANSKTIRQGNPIVCNPLSGTPNWFRVTQGGVYSMVLTVNYSIQNPTWKPSTIVVDGSSHIPVSYVTGKDSAEYTFRFNAQPNSQVGFVSAPGFSEQYQTLTGLIFSLFWQGQAPSISSICTQIKQHAKGETLRAATRQAVCFQAPHNFIPLNVRVFEGVRDRRMECKQPTVVIELQKKVGYCWLDWLVAAGCAVQDQWDTFITISHTDNTITVENVPFMPVMTFLRIIKSLDLSAVFTSRAVLSHVSELQGHIQFSPVDILGNMILIEILSYETIGAKSILTIKSSFQNKSFTSIQKRRKSNKTVKGVFIRPSGSIQFSTIDTGFGRVYNDSMLDCQNVSQLIRSISISTNCSDSEAAEIVQTLTKKAA